MTSHAFIARRPDQEVVATSVDRENGDCAEWCIEMLRDGLTVERVPCEWVRKNFGTKNPYVAEVTP